MDHRLGGPVFFVAEHGPSEHSDLASESDCGFLLASFLLTADSVVDLLRPRVVAKRSPGALDEDRTREGIATFGNSAVAIGFAGLVLPWHKAEVGGNLTTVGESVWIVDASDENLGRSRTHSGDGSNALDARILLSEGFQFLDDGLELRGKRIELRKFDIELATPKFVGFALIEWFSEGVDAFAT